MGMNLKSVVPWGRSFAEYVKMFNLSENDLNKKIASFGDGPTSFNSEMANSGKKVISFDPIYSFDKNKIEKRIKETKTTVLTQVAQNKADFNWTYIKSIQELEQIRMNAMKEFLDDFETGKSELRYIASELPDIRSFDNSTFELGLSSHFLVLYSSLGLEFHIRSIKEMLRLCKEIRIFPLVNLNSTKSEVLDGILEYFSAKYKIEIIKAGYEFQRNGNLMLKIGNF